MVFAPLLSFFSLVLPFVSAEVYDVQVGADGFTYTPEVIGAVPGDQVVFHFRAKNHTVTQSSFTNPCRFKDGGFDSGFMPVAANQTDNLPTFTITINDTNPLWIYCRQASQTPASHCGQGMVFAVNCGQDGQPNSFTNFKKAALAVGASLSAAAASSTTVIAYGGYTNPATLTMTPTYSSYPESSDPTSVAVQDTTHTVVVGGPGKLLFNPPFITAQPRDTVVFQFQQKNHTVTQSSFADPCHKLATGGFDSGFMFVADDATFDYPSWNITINDTNPIWAYCRQQIPTSHCGAGMVFAINPVQNSDRNFTAFQNIAKVLNGTTPSQSAVPSGASSPNGAVSVQMGMVQFALAASVVIATLL